MATVVPLDPLPALTGGYFPLVAEETGRTHHIYVRLPEGYDADATRRWPVVYLLDGDSLFPLLAPTHLFLTYDRGLPEAIVVGIAYGVPARDAVAVPRPGFAGIALAGFVLSCA